jgi:hypothetical protein
MVVVKSFEMSWGGALCNGYSNGYLFELMVDVMVYGMDSMLN